VEDSLNTVYNILLKTESKLKILILILLEQVEKLELVNTIKV